MTPPKSDIERLGEEWESLKRELLIIIEPVFVPIMEKLNRFLEKHKWISK